MNRYLVRQTIERAIVIEAESEEQAYERAAKANAEEWGEDSRGEFEIDENETTPVRNLTPPKGFATIGNGLYARTRR
jgi:hypothetical protein